MIEYIEKLKTDKLFYDRTVARTVRAIASCGDYQKFVDNVYRKEKSVFAEFFQVHFYPLEICEVVDIMLRKTMDEDQDFLESRIVYFFVKALYAGAICYSLVPEAIHEKIHLEHLEYKPSIVYGDLSKFIEMYKDYITDEQTDKCNKFLEGRESK